MSDDIGRKDIASCPDGADQKGESGGGAYPRPKDAEDDGDFKGGASDHSYSGPQDNENATSKEQ